MTAPRTAAGVFALLLAGGPLAAQAPGYEQVDLREVMAEYKAEVLTNVNKHLSEWGDAWSNDRPDELADLYWEDAFLIAPSGTQYRGRNAILAYFESVLADHGQIEAFMLDFDASGGMAQVFGNYMLGIQRGEAAGNQLQGPLITIYLRRGRTWRIRSQIFVPG